MSAFFTIDFPNLSGPDFAPDEGLYLFDQTKHDSAYLKNCLNDFRGRFSGQIPYFIPADEWKKILNPSDHFPDIVPDPGAKLYAVTFCYGTNEHLGPFVYLRIRFIFAIPPKDSLAKTIHANVYSSPIGITVPVSSGSSVKWLTTPAAIAEADRDVARWSEEVHDLVFPETPPLVKNGQVLIREGNIIGKKRLENIYQTEVLDKKKKGITINFAYDKTLKEIFLVFRVNPTYVTLGKNEPLKCPPGSIQAC